MKAELMEGLIMQQQKRYEVYILKYVTSFQVFAKRI
jgi:hypothetical protein